MTTFATSAAIGEREELANIIYRIDPSETPIFLEREEGNLERHLYRVASTGTGIGQHHELP